MRFRVWGPGPGVLTSWKLVDGRWQMADGDAGLSSAREEGFYFVRAKIRRTASAAARITQLHPNQSPCRL